MKKIIKTDQAPLPIGPYNQAVMFGKTLYVSGQIAIEPTTGNLIMDSIEAETEQVIKNIGAILQAAGLGFENVVKCSVFVKDMEMFSRINTIYAKFFEESNAPARELVQVSNLPKYVNVEISCIATAD